MSSVLDRTRARTTKQAKSQPKNSGIYKKLTFSERSLAIYHFSGHKFSALIW